MSQYPPAGLSYASGAYQPNPRPASVTVMAILAIIFGALGLICGGVGLAFQVTNLAMGGRNPIIPNAPAMTDHGVLAYTAVSGFVSWLLCVALLFGGIGALSLKPWARRLLIRWSVFVLIWATINLVVQLAWVGPATAEFTRKTQAQFSRPGTPNLSGMVGPMQIAGAIIGWLLACVLPVLFLTLWRSQRVIAAFEPNMVPPQQS
ncbi:MAG TPA: hypothetical protein VN541_00460 [Tepidisphaeraceae bacterium]|nr:hypothetical protein [Tepidisphaeraceae bacterium]